jgi:UDP-N-acetylglucosamine--N-acetylmuramyl-(pentapeptide) pyrophosphoryl-undecaprenol N-acetylglucosamine transferase
MTMLRLVVTGGGTGGHIYPALAVAELLQGNPPVESVTYIGKTGGLESELVPAAGVPFEGISFYGMPRAKTPLLPFQWIAWFLKLQEAKAIARQKLQTIQPHVVFGTGGYVSAPVLMAAHSLGIPYVVHEPDAQPGLVNRLMSCNACIITTSFSEGADKLRHRADQTVLLTGNPIRGQIGQWGRVEARERMGLTSWSGDRPVLLVTGGSQGSRRINTAIVEALPDLIGKLGFSVVHLTGRTLYDETAAAVEALALSETQAAHYWLQPYSSEMPALLALADLAICRAGSLSLSEMYVCGIPTILVPYPFAASDHQRKNAQASVRAGASRLVEDADCTAERLCAELTPFAENPAQRQQMRQTALRLGHPNATQEIAQALLQFVPPETSDGLPLELSSTPGS